MPKAAGHFIKVVRRDRSTLLFTLYFEGRRIRKVVAIRSLVAFLNGDAEAESNLPEGVAPINFDELVKTRYMPGSAKPRLPNTRSYDAEKDLVNALVAKLGSMPAHLITNKTAEDCKTSWLDASYANNTIKKRINCLYRVLDFAVSKELLKENLIKPPKGLPPAKRNWIWLRLHELITLLPHCDPLLVIFVVYAIMARARAREALDFHVGDVRDGKLFVPTEKRHCPMRQALRCIPTVKLGPHFPELMSRLKPNKGGYYFHLDPDGDKPISYSVMARLFREAREPAGLGHVTLHDLRRTGTMHGAINRESFLELKTYLGQTHAASIQTYLDQAQQFDPNESLFYDPAKDPRSLNSSNGQTSLQTSHLWPENSPKPEDKKP